MLLAALIIPNYAYAGRYTNAIAAAGGLQGRILWIDAEANLQNLDSPEKVAAIVDHCKKANINIIVLDVKLISGFVTYNSRIAPHVKFVNGKPYPQDFDVLKTMIDEGHKAGIAVYANINTFAEGVVRNNIQTGPAFDHPEWQSIKYQPERWLKAPDGSAYPVDGINVTPQPGRLNLYTDSKAVPATIPAGGMCVLIGSDGIVIMTDPGPCPCDLPTSKNFVLTASGPAAQWLRAYPAGTKLTLEARPSLVPMGKSPDEHNAVFVNPANCQVQAYELSIVREIIRGYCVDGIVFDRMRYAGIETDFSNLSRLLFEKWLGRQVEHFPQDIFTYDPTPGHEVIHGKLFGKWMEWRAGVIHDFVAEARKEVKAIKPEARVAAYVGSWYGSYYTVGVNWASPSHQPPYDWAGPGYKKTGFANLLDWLSTGCYSPYPTDADARAANNDWSVESAGAESNAVVEDDTWVYGGLYLLLYDGNKSGLERAIKAAAGATQGVMLFDLSYIIDAKLWDLLERSFTTPAQPPHTIPGLLDEVKKVKKVVEEGKAQVK